MAVVINPNTSAIYRSPNVALVTIGFKKQRMVGETIIDTYRTATERAVLETLTISGLINGSEVRLMDAITGVEIPGGVETSSTPSLTFSYPKPSVTSTVRLLIILAGYRVISQLYYTGLGNSSQPVYYSPDPAYIT